MTKEQILGVVRHLLTFFGGILVTKGLVDETIVTEIIGGLSTLIGAIWSFFSKTVVTTPIVTPAETPKVAKKGK
jgi:hypothetical protein